MAVSSVMSGSPTVWPLGRFDPATVLQLTRDERISVWGGGTTHIVRLLQHPDIDTIDATRLSEEQLLAWRGDRVCGRIAAIDDALHRQTHGDNAAMFGFFEADDADASRGLFEAAALTCGHRGKGFGKRDILLDMLQTGHANTGERNWQRKGVGEQFFEWSRAEFQAWAHTMADQFRYGVRFLSVGAEDPDAGPPTQMAIFSRNGDEQ